MTEFDYQWKNLHAKDIEYNDVRIKEFLSFTKLNPKKIFSEGIVWMLDPVLGDIRTPY